MAYRKALLKKKKLDGPCYMDNQRSETTYMTIPIESIDIMEATHILSLPYSQFILQVDDMKSRCLATGTEILVGYQHGLRP